MSGWHKGMPVIWYERAYGQPTSRWLCQVCGASGAHERLSFAWTEGQAHRKVVHPDA